MRVEAGTDAALIARMLELVRPQVERATIAAGPETHLHQAKTNETGAPPPAAAQPPPAEELPPAALPVAGGPTLPAVILWLPAPQPAPFQTPADSDQGAPQPRSRPEAGEAAFVLHVPSAGAIEIRLALIRGAVRATVTIPAGEIGDRALVSRDDLIARLTRATGRPAVADVRIRPTTHIDLRA